MDASGGDVVGAGAARALAREVRAVIDRDVRAGLTVHSTRLGRVAAALGVALLVADAVALFSVFAFLLNLDWSAPDQADLVTAVALALFGAGVQAELATVLGHRLWARRGSAAGGDADAPGEEEPAPGWVIGLLSVALLLVGLLTAAAIKARLSVEGELADAAVIAEPLAWPLAAAALCAPWVIVAHHTFDGSWATRREAALGAVVMLHERLLDGERRSRERSEHAAGRWAGRADR